MENEINIERYCENREVDLRRSLGTGTQGSVYVGYSPRHRGPFAVKFHGRRIAYDRELSVYRRLRGLQVTMIRGHHVPQYLGHEDETMAIEMTIVNAPFCLDFGGAYLDHPPDYSRQVWQDWRKQKSEAFEANWPAVEEILAEFRLFGIYIADVNPGNIRF